MANREKAVRYSFYEALNGNIIYESANVPLTDSILNQGQDDPFYIVIDNQTAINNQEGANIMQAWDCEITLVIVSKQPFSVSKDILDDIAEQIENIIIPSATTTELPQQSGWHIHQPLLKSAIFREVSISTTATVILKTITFAMKVVKQ